MQPIRRLHISGFGAGRQGGDLRSRPLPTITNVWREFRLVLNHGSSLFLKLLKLFCCFSITRTRLHGQLRFFRRANLLILGRFVCASRRRYRYQRRQKKMAVARHGPNARH